VFENPDALGRFFPADPSSPVEISRYAETTNRIAFHVRVPGAVPARTVGSIVQDGGWTAREGGREDLATGLARGLFLEIVLPPGEHDVVLEYSPPGFRAGCAISLLGVLALFAALAWTAPDDRKRARKAGAGAAVS
jgi:hypothetical protein